MQAAADPPSATHRCNEAHHHAIVLFQTSDAMRRVCKLGATAASALFNAAAAAVGLAAAV
jgi:hypothetical protein